VRDPEEFARGHVEGATSIPLNSLRGRMNELPRDRQIMVYCSVGQRSYYASRALRLNGFSARNVSGGITNYRAETGGPALEGPEETEPTG
jgi:rhodanese-related sulfurtransferase